MDRRARVAFLSVVCSFEYGCVISFGQVVSEFLCSFSLLQVFRKEEITLAKVLPSETLGRMKRALYVRYNYYYYLIEPSDHMGSSLNPLMALGLAHRSGLLFF